MKLFIDIVMKRIYLFNIVAWNYRKKIGFPVCKKENFAGLQAHRKRGKSARASPTPHHTLNEERSARFTAQPLSALVPTDSSSAPLYLQKFFNNRFRPFFNYCGNFSHSSKRSIAHWPSKLQFTLLADNQNGTCTCEVFLCRDRKYYLWFLTW